jgi:peptidoglycan/LPS O-acetylase OafA/YrhL
MALTNYRPDIDGLRAIAVLAVVLHHLSASLVPGGYVGVDVFFVISGYLITSIISREMAEGQFTFTGFYERRARRIFPALFAMLAVTLVAGYFLLLPSDMVATLRGALGTLFFASNVVFWRDMAAGYFAATDAVLNPLLHTWSLAVEEQFYVFFPVLLLLCYRYARRHIVWVLIVGAAVSLGGAALLVKSKGVAVFFLSPFRAWELLAGSLLAFNASPLLRSRIVRELTAGAGLAAIVAACFLYDAKTVFPGLTALVPVLGAVAIIHAGASGSSFVGNLLQRRPMVYVGLISYSLYLWHWPLIVLVRYATGMEPLTSWIPVLFVVSLLLGSLSYRFIEQPFRRGARFGRRFIFASSAVFASLLALVSSVGLVRDGFETRFGAEVVRLDKARTPVIPFRDCDNRPQESWCELGISSATPSLLLWGDSHALAWAPAVDASLQSANKRALFAPSSACPPMLGISNEIKSDCRQQNDVVKNYLLAHPEITTVVLAGFWSDYFNGNLPLSVTTGAKGTAAASKGLTDTLQWLRDNDRQVILIGPVPVYDKSVPLALALGAATNRNLLQSTELGQRARNFPFYKVVSAVQSSHSFRFIDPIEWMCSGECVTMRAGVPLYRDANHLSLAGAQAMQDKLAIGLGI